MVPSAGKRLGEPDAVRDSGGWYHVAAVYDGKVFTNYVNGVKDAEAEVALSPQGPGRSSMGVRINQVYYFKGAIHSARFTRRALAPSAFQKPPAAVAAPSRR
jgi:Concanavalin A-like lectin/glucanases superfamily